jgi:hypothetical protein
MRDSAFIAAIHNAWPQVSARLRELEKENDKGVRCCGGCPDCIGIGAHHEIRALRAQLEAIRSHLGIEYHDTDTAERARLMVLQSDSLRAQLAEVTRECEELREKRDRVLKRANAEIEGYRANEELITMENDAADKLAANIAKRIVRDLR